MIKDKITIVDIIRKDELLIIDWITIHFGKNPKIGGNPQKADWVGKVDSILAIECLAN